MAADRAENMRQSGVSDKTGGCGDGMARGVYAFWVYRRETA